MNEMQNLLVNLNSVCEILEIRHNLKNRLDYYPILKRKKQKE